MSFNTTDLYVRMPGVGLIARNERNFQPGEHGWMNAESQLCIEYKKYVHQITEKEFMQRIEYLKAANDLGRTPMGLGRRIFLFLLVVAEAAGFSFLLATSIAVDATPTLATYLMCAVVLVLASILATITHQAGEQFYRTRLKRACFARYRESNIPGTHTTGPVALSDDQFRDADDLPARRTLNRITESDRDMGSYSKCWVAFIFVLTIFGLSAVMRLAQMDSDINDESAAQTTSASDPFKGKSTAPAELTMEQKKADDQSGREHVIYTRDGRIAAILILSAIFLVTQIVGFSAGYKHCFAGRQTHVPVEGKNRFWQWKEWSGAYADTWGFATYQQYWSALAPVKATVNKRLKELQKRLNENSPVNLNLHKTFEDYLAEDAARDRQRRWELNNVEDPPPSPSGFPHRPPAPATAPTPPSPPRPRPAAREEPPAEAQEPVKTVDQAKADIEALGTKDAQFDYIESLPAEMQRALKPWLLERKQEAEAQRVKRRDDLL